MCSSDLVPAYFNDSQRQATKDAGRIAGLDVKRIINEPTAAALAFGLDKTEKGDRKIAVYDLGGGTFDVTVLEIDGNIYRMLSTDGDMQLGGRDWDQRLIDFLAEQFIREHGVDPRDDANQLGRMWRDCEEAKRTLSVRQRTFLACEYRGRTLQLEITRAAFQEMTRDLLDRTAFTAQEALQAGAITRAVPEGEHLKVAGEYARQLLKNPPLAVRAVVRTRRQYLLENQRQSFLLAEASPALHLTRDFQEAAKAFVEKRPPPRFEGR